MIVKRFTVLLSETICVALWKAYEKGLFVILNEEEFLEVFELLTENPTKVTFADVTLMYGDDGVFDRILLPSLKKDTFICEHYKD